MNKTYIQKKSKKAQWYLIDAKNQTLGRICTKIATTIRGKNNYYYNPYLINNEYIIVINAEHIQISGQKKYQKKYYRHSGRPGSLKKENFEQLKKRIPNRIIEKGVRGMLPKNRLGRILFNHLKVYSGKAHPHNAQNPTILSLN
uniref:Ribosomal protein L13 n=1 Tax=Synarthrophyton chejuense TaxID=2485825 RepID=A0A3G3MFW6_9FLOR|nr:ribosomal protein L13 [Synarthrophyton chejuense]AYR05712.1 ribosomal protein L13 [Synarthrophyton chejuense]